MTQEATSKPQTTIDEKMEEILVCLRRMDARDKLRTWGGFVRTLISIIPIILLIWSSWYIVQHGAELMKMVANTAASSAAEYTKGSSQGMVDELLKKYSIPGQK